MIDDSHATTSGSNSLQLDSDNCPSMPFVGPTNKHRYLIASDSRKLREHVREEVVGVPLVHTNQSRIIVLERMSDKTKARLVEVSLPDRDSRISERPEADRHARCINQMEQAKYGGAVDEVTVGDNVIGATVTAPSQSKPAVPSSAKTRRPKEANPLSNKKPKKVLEAERKEKDRRRLEIEQRTAEKRKASEDGVPAVKTTGASAVPLRAASIHKATSPSEVGDGDERKPKRRRRGGRGGGGGGSSSQSALVDA